MRNIGPIYFNYLDIITKLPVSSTISIRSYLTLNSLVPYLEESGDESIMEDPCESNLGLFADLFGELESGDQSLSWLSGNLSMFEYFESYFGLEGELPELEYLTEFGNPETEFGNPEIGSYCGPLFLSCLGTLLTSKS